MSWKEAKSIQELKDFWNEIVVENGPRYRHPKEWHHLWVDFWNAFFDMNYTLGHIVAIGLPIGLILLWVF